MRSSAKPTFKSPRRDAPAPVALAITAGDPCGIGPEVILKALRSLRRPHGLRLIVIGDCRVFERTAGRLRARIPSWVEWLECASRGRFVPGRSGPHAGAASVAYLDCAITLAKAGVIDGVVTAPVTKWAVQQVKRGFQGHTEYFAQAFGAREVTMLFVSEPLRVALLTRHVPLRRVASAITPALLQATASSLHTTLKNDFHIHSPHLALLGINPHAGETGHAPGEERAWLPALRHLRRRGIRCDGPFAADGFFGAAAWRNFDAVLAPYHDQGLVPFKMLARDEGCQMTVGLPIIRTSPDHGSALDIAGRGAADAGSMRYAIRLAIRLLHAHRR